MGICASVLLLDTGTCMYVFVLLRLGSTLLGVFISAKPFLRPTHHPHSMDKDVPRFSKEIVQGPGVGTVA